MSCDDAKDRWKCRPMNDREMLDWIIQDLSARLENARFENARPEYTNPKNKKNKKNRLKKTEKTEVTSV